MQSEVIISIGTSALLAFILFSKSFWSEKGKNLATKQDIGDITQKVEEIKVFYTKDIESLKYQLGASLHHQNKLTDLTILNLLEFQDCILTLIKSKFKKSFSETKSNELVDEVYLHHKETNLLFNKADILHTKLIVFAAGNHSLVQSIINLIDNLMQAKEIYDKHKHYITIYTVFEYSLTPLNKFRTNVVQERIKIINEYETEFNPVYKNLISSLDYFNNELIIFFKKRKLIE